ncbi:probable histone-arginine methyltransferase 1.4 isoform X1 [Arachis ipaensis]|uniref:probable histone-arginine methyltransferase 1.4 isoform X1 n=2 Tax=Arachis ipaensis TaxID=130454 RepID=UPI000A2B8DFB|nr:probable histone-arginine methyltransferase 1.4 isoform X1 [Arachis ipaensis]XP_025646627.1 probable histone-arginine methyltransferase 1.4 isoform X1 [Arachis hypogaea]
MEDSVAMQKRKHREFALASISELCSSLIPPPPSEAGSSSPGIARFASGDGSLPELQILRESNQVALNVDLRAAQIFRLGPVQSVCMVEGSDAGKQTSYSRGVAIQFRNEEDSEAFHCVYQQWKKEFNVQVDCFQPGGNLPNGTNAITSKSKFDEKIESSSAKMYFHYYGQLLHQQNMLQDYVRTGTYYAAVIENRADFMGRVVVDVGAGSGILSLFAAQAGAKHVYAVEASEMAEYARKLIAGNPILGQRITVIKGKVEDVELPEKADILISEPMGTLLVNERMLESYVIARDRFLTPHGKMFPSVGRIHMAPFSDEYLFVEIANKALFWQQQNYFGVDLTPLHGTAFQGYFSQPVVDAFDPRLLVAPPSFHVIDFNKIKEEELYEIDIPLRFISTVGARVHGLACWFDVLFNGSTVQRWLTTAPGSPTTHWYQLRCVLSQPIYVMAGQEITGRLHLIAHNAQSYTIYLTLSAKMWGPGAEQGGILQTSSCKLDLKEPYYRMSQPQVYPVSQDQQPQSLIQTQDVNIQSQDLDEAELMQQPSPNSCAQIDSLMQNA